MAYKIRNWAKFQHFKDRRPPWIKLYREILDDIEWHRLSGDAAKALIMIWLIGSESDGEIPATKELAFRLRLTEKQTQGLIGSLYDCGFISESDGFPIIEEGLTPAQKIAKNNGFGSRYVSDEIKRQVLIRDKGVCVSCSSSERIEFDHIHPISKGGESTIENIQLLCRPCNRKKRSRVAETGAASTSALRSPETEAERETEKEKTLAPNDGAFEQFWKAYPKKRSKGAALKAWRKLNPSMEQLNRILHAIGRAKISAEWVKDSGQYIPHPASWLNGMCWEDEFVSVNGSSGVIG